ncbi:MAG: c-type cytochrome [Marinovum algicola]|jgi:cytochrome c|uniref:Cytochrome c553 n=1 Tax=Marinovum algicola TaxID=42444 RepID=A0A975WEP1_9RHOB|nr:MULTISPECIES: c-type cytochrome [Marinovum]MDD9738155.1 c-type cytochrome [Marinovum sp. SP66]SEK07941.1 Cytochrome c553 [Marinovum algicola]SLN36529.1 Cytochrome subunit of sulfide dehydrogenase [Marinovum algicola]
MPVAPRPLTVALALCLGWAAAVTAEEETEIGEILAIEGDPEYGEYLSSECTTCHQASGSDAIPAIVGWPQEAFVVALHGYKSGQRSHPAMQMIAGRLSDEEIAALAAYFGTLAP